MARRKIISISVSEQNADAVVVMRALAERNIRLTRCGGQLLAWAAAHLTAPPPIPAPEVPLEEETFGMSTSDLHALLDDF